MDEPRTVLPPVPRRVRRAEARDVAAMHAVVGLADLERSPASVEATADDLRAALLGGPVQQAARAHVVEVHRVGRRADGGADHVVPGRRRPRSALAATAEGSRGG